ncbi:MAG: SDR family NAD(P)-dependent oxidoreductase [Nitrospinales bacterium]
MEINLKDRKVVITGVGDGIGRELALSFSRSGAQVAGCSRNEERLISLSKEIEGKNHLFLPTDLTKMEEIQKFHDKTLASFGNLDILVNNVGSVLKLKNFFELSDQDWLDSFNINLMAGVRLARLFTPSLKKSKAGRIINISSIAGSRPGEIFPHYSAMKAGLSNFTVSLANTLASDNITVNTVSPGPVWSQSWEKEAEETSKTSGESIGIVSEEIRSSTSQAVPLKRMGVPDDVTGIVLFLASDHASWITAANFPVDGGITQDPY